MIIATLLYDYRNPNKQESRKLPELNLYGSCDNCSDVYLLNAEWKGFVPEDYKQNRERSLTFVLDARKKEISELEKYIQMHPLNIKKTFEYRRKIKEETEFMNICELDLKELRDHGVVFDDLRFAAYKWLKSKGFKQMSSGLWGTTENCMHVEIWTLDDVST